MFGTGDRGRRCPGARTARDVRRRARLGLYASSEYGRILWETLVEAGTDRGLVPCGYRAIDSLRLEKGYRFWSTDVGPETTPDEAGLGFCVKLDKPGGFIGADAVRAAREEGVRRSLAAWFSTTRSASSSEPSQSVSTGRWWAG